MISMADNYNYGKLAITYILSSFTGIGSSQPIVQPPSTLTHSRWHKMTRSQSSCHPGEIYSKKYDAWKKTSIVRCLYNERFVLKWLAVKVILYNWSYIKC